MPQHYRVFGLSVESEIPCPELLPGEPRVPSDIIFRLTDVPEALERPADSGARWQTAPGVFLLDLPRVARFLVHDGREILIQPRPQISEETIRTFLLSACLSILLHQRRLFAVHCSAIHTPQGAVLFAGNSGMGKSTLVSAFLERGHRFIADDMAALTFNDREQVMALPGFPQLKLWADSARALGRSTMGLQRVLPEQDRFFAPEVQRFHAEPSALRAMYFLSVHNKPQFALEPLAHAPRFNALLNHTWQKLTLPGLGLREWHFQTAARIASATYGARLTRPRDPLDVHTAVGLIEADLQALPLPE